MGVDLDKEVVASLFTEWPGAVPEFSTRDSAAGYLLRYLKRARVHSTIVFANGAPAESAWRCELVHRGERVSSEYGATRPLAIARAVVAAHVIPGRRSRTVSSAGRARWTPESVPEFRDCAHCGVRLKTAKGAPSVPRYCNVCGWQQIRDWVESQTPDRSNG